MRYRHRLIKIVILFAIISATQGIAPAPGCPSGCGTAAAFSRYMDAMQSQPGMFTQLLNYLLAVL